MASFGGVWVVSGCLGLDFVWLRLWWVLCVVDSCGGIYGLSMVCILCAYYLVVGVWFVLLVFVCGVASWLIVGIVCFMVGECIVCDALFGWF